MEKEKFFSVVEDGMKLKLFVNFWFLLIEDRTYLFQIASKVLHTKVWLIFTRGRNCLLDSVHFKVWEVLLFVMSLWALLPLTQP